MKQFTYRKHDVNQYQVLDADGFDYLGEYVSHREAVKICKDQNAVISAKSKEAMLKVFNLALAVAYQRGINGESFNLGSIEDATNEITSLFTETELAEVLNDKWQLLEIVSVNV